MSHTPGPWKVKGKAPMDVVSPAHSKEFPGEPTVCRVGGTKPTDLANARLIAAAPELLNACNEALDWALLEKNEELTRTLRAAIAQARGGK